MSLLSVLKIWVEASNSTLPLSSSVYKSHPFGVLGGLLKVHGARSRSSLLRNKHRIALKVVSISQPACWLWTASLHVLFLRGCLTENTLDFRRVGPGCPVPGSDDQGAEAAFVWLGFVFRPLFPRTEWMLDGSGSRPWAFFLSPEVFLDSICGEMSRIIMLVQPDFHGQRVLWSVQHSCTEGKKRVFTQMKPTQTGSSF